MKIVFGINELAKWNLVNANVVNLLVEDPTLEIVIVAFSEAVTFYTDPDFKPHPKATYFACNNSVQTRIDDKTKINEVVNLTNSGVYKIVTLQKQGYYYISA